jgi:hypothetical protein
MQTITQANSKHENLLAHQIHFAVSKVKSLKI